MSSAASRSAQTTQKMFALLFAAASAGDMTKAYHHHATRLRDLASRNASYLDVFFTVLDHLPLDKQIGELKMFLKFDARHNYGAVIEEIFVRTAKQPVADRIDTLLDMLAHSENIEPLKNYQGLMRGLIQDAFSSISNPHDRFIAAYNYWCNTSAFAEVSYIIGEVTKSAFERLDPETRFNHALREIKKDLPENAKEYLIKAAVEIVCEMPNETCDGAARTLWKALPAGHAQRPLLRRHMTDGGADKPMGLTEFVNGMSALPKPTL